MAESFAQLFEESLSHKQMRPGAIITGKVVQIDRDYVIINAGLKSEGVIPIEQFYNERGVRTDDSPIDKRCITQKNPDGWRCIIGNDIALTSSNFKRGNGAACIQCFGLIGSV